MKRRKNMLLFVFIMALSFALAACGSSNSGNGGENNSAGEAPAAGQSDIAGSEPAEAETDGGNVLIAYFSVMETDGVDTVAGASRIAIGGETLGNNQYVAQIIQRETGGDLFAIETV